MNNEPLSEVNFLLYAAKYYNNQQYYDTIEFYDDLKRFNYIKRLLNHYSECGELKDRLILNHIIVLNNVFGVEHTAKMLFFKMRKYHPQLKPFLEFLGIMPERILNIGIKAENIISKNIENDKYIEDALRKI